MRYAWYGDDFTGASDTLATVAAAGLRSALFLAPPQPAQLQRLGALDALGIAGTARGLDPAAMQQELALVATSLAALQPDVTHYKCCSTFDSAPQVGNLAMGLRGLRQPAHDPSALVLGGQPSLGRYCVFGQLFASAGQGGEVFRIDRHPTMRQHPVTPMHEADLRQHLAAQGLAPMRLVDLRLLEGPPEALAQAVGDAASDSQALLFDVLSDAHLQVIGQLIWQRAVQRPQLLLGASSVAQALLSAWPDARLNDMAGAAEPVAQGPVFLMVGSLSPVTAAQVAYATTGGAYERIELPANDLVNLPSRLQDMAALCAARLAAGRSVLAQMAAAGTGETATPLAVAQAGGRLLRQVLDRAPAVRRVGLAGGDTSSWALRALAPWALRWQATLAPGVPLLRAHADDPAIDGLTLMLKGGQMGPPDLFERLVRG